MDRFLVRCCQNPSESVTESETNNAPAPVTFKTHSDRADDLVPVTKARKIIDKNRGFKDSWNFE